MRIAAAAIMALIIMGCGDDQPRETTQQKMTQAQAICESYGQTYAAATYEAGSWTAICIQRSPTEVVRHDMG